MRPRLSEEFLAICQAIARHRPPAAQDKLPPTGRAGYRRRHRAQFSRPMLRPSAARPEGRVAFLRQISPMLLC